MTLFWIISGAAVLVVSAVLALALLRGQSAGDDAQASDLAVYRDQLREIEQGAARGAIPPEEAERLRTEVSRRILSADARKDGAPQRKQSRAATLLLSGLIALLLLGGSFALYWRLGAPGYRDLGLQSRVAMAQERRESRPSQADAEAQLPPAPVPDASEEYLALVEKLRSTVQQRPDDLRGFQLLARSEAALGNYADAYRAQQRLIELQGDAAQAQDYADLADMQVMAAGGYVSPETERVLDEIMRRDPENGVARYYGGLMMAQTGRPDAAFRIWDKLLRESPNDAPWVPAIRNQIAELAMLAGVNDYTPPVAALSGPSAEDMQAASQMSDEDRQEMIRGMVEGLSDRLATQGGGAQEWAQLIGALAVLGETARASEIWNEAQTVFAAQPSALATLREAATRSGLVE
ncbi:c-type cytochrome biogenesis protein CcmI [Citreicella sp. C3M06]|uniref:c-type cytochrome biogenesis protein CcmI n=1 Tax=Citreicella sp. C3M06 TaxID=2841564 RepID=UPI001C09AAF1|nr:c-type cytochrome biogenesis protein CcmI [Citreicella sp. C3M06]MBU2961813.1 c-type cytochrome biogenesis protein CcmI [Citreicella sp. C3M06]